MQGLMLDCGVCSKEICDFVECPVCHKRICEDCVSRNVCNACKQHTSEAYLREEHYVLAPDGSLHTPMRRSHPTVLNLPSVDVHTVHAGKTPSHCKHTDTRV